MKAVLDEACEVNSVHPEAIESAKRAMPGEHCIEGASLLLKAVADPTRLRILAALAQVELCVCDLAALINVSESAVSHQLRLLRVQRLVASRKEGRIVYYRLLDEHVNLLLQSAFEHAKES